jgi:oxygen-independent coproporphyrinogen III oxidase
MNTGSPEKADFWGSWKKRSYCELFYIRTKIWRGRLAPLDPINSRWQYLQNENRFPQSMNMIYIHIPFCATRCKFCLYFTRKYSKEKVKRYLDALEREIKLASATPYCRSTKFISVYVGGGTPSTLSLKEMERLAEIIRSSFNLSDNAEITLEANPSSLTPEKIKCLKENGFTRISLGVQTFNEEMLRKMGCAHTVERARTIIDHIGHEKLLTNLDMIYGLNGNDLPSVLKDFRTAASFDAVQHITAFPLRLVHETPLYEDLSAEQEVNIIQENRKLAELCVHVEKCLDENNFSQEEESTLYNRRGYREHLYRSLEGRILGFGAGAGSLLDNVESGNLFDPEEYTKSIENNESYIFTDSLISEQQNRERFILYRILFMNRSKEDFVTNIKAGYRRFFGEDIGERYDKIVTDLLERNFMVVKENRLQMSKKLQLILSNFRFGTPSLV